MVRLVGYGYERGDRVTLTAQESTRVAGEDRGDPVKYSIPLGSTGRVDNDQSIDSDEEVYVQWDNGSYGYVHFGCLTPIITPPVDLNDPNEIEKFLETP